MSLIRFHKMHGSIDFEFFSTHNYVHIILMVVYLTIFDHQILILETDIQPLLETMYENNTGKSPSSKAEIEACGNKCMSLKQVYRWVSKSI